MYVPCRYVEFEFSAFRTGGRRPPKPDSVLTFPTRFWWVDDLFAQDSNGRAVRTNLRDGLQQGLHLLLCSLCPITPSTTCSLCPTCHRPSSIHSIQPGHNRAAEAAGPLSLPPHAPRMLPAHAPCWVGPLIVSHPHTHPLAVAGLTTSLARAVRAARGFRGGSGARSPRMTGSSGRGLGGGPPGGRGAKRSGPARACCGLLGGTFEAVTALVIRLSFRILHFERPRPP
jgi:hypothetical protein